jgi:rRNA biogenesis protein RRP5
VPITSISDKITTRIEAIAQKEDTEDDNEDEDEDADDVDLHTLFTIGQYLRAYVVSTSDDANSGKSKRRIELSLQPQQSNGDLTRQNIIPNSMLMASVSSVEDHGVIMDIGLSGSDVRGFLSSNEIGNGLELSSIQEGAVFLCMVTGLSSNGKIVKLCADTQKIGNLKKSGYLTEAPTVDTFLPGTAVEMLVADITPRGIVGKVMGMVDLTADLIHSGAAVSNKNLEKKYKVGSKIKGRIICTFPNSVPLKFGFSLLDHVMCFGPQLGTKDRKRENPVEVLPLSTIIESVTVQKVEPGVGLFVDVGVKSVSGFVHISRVKDGKIETLLESSGRYKLGSVHRGRIIGYNSVDGVYLLSLEPSVLEQPFLRIEDLKIAEVVKGRIEKIVINATGVGGVLVNLADGITGLVPEVHMADVQLLHPEKKFREGMTVTARVLSTDPSKRQIRLTLKKSLVNSEATPFISYNNINPGMQSPGTIVNILPTGAVVQFYGTVRGFLPVYEMSEAYIQDPNQHFRVGQVVNVHVLKVDRDANKLVVSCKDPSGFGLAQQAALKKLNIGDIVSATVTEKSSDDITVELQNLGLKAVLSVSHMTDGSEAKSLSAMKKIRVGQVLSDLAVLDKLEQRHLIILTNKPSLVKAAKDRTFLRSFHDVKENRLVQGFVKNTTLKDVFVQFGGGLVGLLPKTKLPAEVTSLPDFGMKKFQPVEAKIISVDHDMQRFVLSITDTTNDNEAAKNIKESTEGADQTAINAIDHSINFIGDLTIGKLIKAKIVSIKETQMNVQLADNIQGRIDISQVFDTWEEIKDRKRPLKRFSKGLLVPVCVLGIHDARNHRFLPITHRSGKTVVFELSAKPSDQGETAKEPVTLDKIKVGSSWIAFVNNIGSDCIWVNLSPNIRGRIRHLDLSDDVSLLTDIESNFPIGSAIRVHATSVDVKNNRLDLSARSAQSSEPLTLKTLSKGMVLPGKVTRVNERHIMVQLSDNVSGPVNLPDLSDDFEEADPTKYSKNEIVRVCVTDIDAPNKRISLSTRPSRVLNSSLPVQDPEISLSQVKVGDTLRGFVKDVSDKGLFINLGHNLKAYVRVSDLSDSYLKDWKSNFEVDQLVKGKIIAVDENLGHIQMSLKASVLDENYVPPLTFNDVKVGQVITGKIRKVEDFGVFIVIDNSANVSGLCHQSEMAEKRVHNVKQIYDEGDAVKAIVLKIDPEKKRINFGLKASYFEDGEGSAEESDDDDLSGMRGVKLTESSDDGDSDDKENRLDLDDVASIISTDDNNEDSDHEMEDVDDEDVVALNASGFDWSGDILGQDEESDGEPGDDNADDKPKKKKRRKAEIKIDRTGDLDANGPQSVSDFERLLLGQPDSSQLWIAYMAFQVQLSELGKARGVAERAIKAINIREETEKCNVWSAWLNLEVEYGTTETLEDVFKRACQYNDAQEVHETLISIYIQSEKHNVSTSNCYSQYEMLIHKIESG